MLLNVIKCYFVPFCLNWHGQGKQSKRIFKSWHQNQRQHSSPANDWSNRQLEFFFFFFSLLFLTGSKDPPYAKGMVITKVKLFEERGGVSLLKWILFGICHHDRIFWCFFAFRISVFHFSCRWLAFPDNWLSAI